MMKLQKDLNKEILTCIVRIEYSCCFEAGRQSVFCMICWINSLNDYGQDIKSSAYNSTAKKIKSLMLHTSSSIMFEKC